MLINEFGIFYVTKEKEKKFYKSVADLVELEKVLKSKHFLRTIKMSISVEVAQLPEKYRDPKYTETPEVK